MVYHDDEITQERIDVSCKDANQIYEKHCKELVKNSIKCYYVIFSINNDWNYQGFAVFDPNKKGIASRFANDYNGILIPIYKEEDYE